VEAWSTCALIEGLGLKGKKQVYYCAKERGVSPAEEGGGEN